MDSCGPLFWFHGLQRQLGLVCGGTVTFVCSVFCRVLKQFCEGYIVAEL